MTTETKPNSDATLTCVFELSDGEPCGEPVTVARQTWRKSRMVHYCNFHWRVYDRNA
jgi:hypothetical protein